MEQLERYRRQPHLYEIIFDNPNVTAQNALSNMKDQLENKAETEETKLPSMKDLKRQAKENGN